MPTAADTGLPPKVLKYMLRSVNALTSSGRATTPAKRMTVAHGLAQRDDVGNDAEPLVAPHMAAQPAEARLHLVGDEEAAGGVHVRERLRHESRGHRRQSLAGERRAEQQARETDPGGGECLDRALDVVRVGGRERLVAAAGAIAVRIHHRNGAHIGTALVRRA